MRAAPKDGNGPPSVTARKRHGPKRAGSGPDWRAELKRLDGAYSHNTLRGYAADLRVYEHWCLNAGLPPFTGDSDVLLRFLAERLEGCAPNSIKRSLAALRRMYQLLRMPDPLGDEDVKLAVRRSLRRNGRPTGQALGLGAQLRDRLVSACPETIKGVRDRALIAVGYDVLASLRARRPQP